MSLRDEIHKEIVLKDYVCLVCQGNLGPKNAIWSCSCCFRCFDLGCIRKWGEKELRTRKAWRCPICFKSYNSNPSKLKYRCWCGKAAAKGGNLPHSCGQTCGAKRECPHPCPLTCHAGPHLDCSECMFQGPEVKCFCGHDSIRTVCSSTPYEGYKCERICGREKCEYGHICRRKCHRPSKAGCGVCNDTVVASCLCGKNKNKKYHCKKLSPEARKRARAGHKISCNRTCNKFFECEFHKCQSGCHAHSRKALPCPFTPKSDEKCFCGKNLTKRVKCNDPLIPCGEICGKTLRCGHKCSSKCHEGECTPCSILVESKCECGQENVEVTCHQLHTKGVHCQNPCPQFLTCRQHKCRRLCCKFSKHNPVDETMTRSLQKAKRGITVSLSELSLGNIRELSSSLPEFQGPQLSEEEQAAHMCFRECGKLLDCGNHTCKKMCHPGKCSPCKLNIYEEYICPCGRTAMEPPYKCGTPPPFCPFLCPRVQSCGHSEQHLCHSDDEGCPPCTSFVKTPCRCGKTLRDTVCSANETQLERVRCMEICRKKLDCGHTCTKTCCVDCQPCTEMCTTVYEQCGHKHEVPCHYDSPCEDTCKKKLSTTCYCGVLKCEYECGEDLEIYCNETCLRETYPESLVMAYQANPSWFIPLEEKIRQLVQSKTMHSFTFKPMSTPNRKLLYSLIEHYGLEGEGVDLNENRSVRAFKTFKTWMPTIRLSEASLKRPRYYVNGFLVQRDEETKGWVIDLSGEV